jgi:hypothetical protein
MKTKSVIVMELSIALSPGLLKQPRSLTHAAPWNHDQHGVHG